MSVHSVKIKNNKKCNRIDDLCTMLRFLYNSEKTQKKLLSLLNNYKTLLCDLSKKIFSKNDNFTHVKQIIVNATNILYNDIIILLTSRSDNVQICNIVTCSRHVSGFTIYSKAKDNNIEYNIYYFINSMRIQHSNNMIKIVYNDKCNMPQDIMFIGAKHDKYDCIDKLLEKISFNVENAITKIRVINLKHVQMLNNLQNILDNSS